MATESNHGRFGILAFAVLHLFCCGLPLLLASGFSLAFLKPQWPVFGVAIAVIGIVGFAWYVKRGCVACPRKEGRCSLENTKQ
jgi:hypothetical protein